jgi:hypothetical protein
MGKVLESGQRSAGASGKDYARRPTSYKGSLALKRDTHTYRKKSRSRSPDRITAGSGRGGRDRRDRDRDRRRSPPPRNEDVYQAAAQSDDAVAAAAKSNYLKSRYGDASAR